MSNIAIKVENLSKRYRIGLKEEIHDTMVEAITDFVKRPLKNLRRLRRLSNFNENGNESEDIIWALKDISFEVKWGEVIGIIGHNGSGKSTLLKILSRITSPTKGSAITNGRVASLLEVGTGFHPELTGRENIYLNGTVLGMKKKEVDRKFDEIVDFSGVEKYIDTPVKRYSTGMKVRLAFSVAAHLEPNIFFIDEVLAVGDAEFQKKCLGKMDNIAIEGRTILFVSHNMSAIERLCHKAILLNNGKVEYSGKSAETIDHYIGQKKISADYYSNLTGHPGRKDLNQTLFQSIRIMNNRGEDTSAIKVGEGLIFEILVDSDTEKIKSPFITISITDSRERYICRLSTKYMVSEPFELSGQKMLRCHWKSCWLAPGKYIITLVAREPGRVLDRIRDATAFEVKPTDINHTGKFDNTPGVIVTEGRWDIP